MELETTKSESRIAAEPAATGLAGFREEPSAFRSAIARGLLGLGFLALGSSALCAGPRSQQQAEPAAGPITWEHGGSCVALESHSVLSNGELGYRFEIDTAAYPAAEWTLLEVRARSRTASEVSLSDPWQSAGWNARGGARLFTSVAVPHDGRAVHELPLHPTADLAGMTLTVRTVIGPPVVRCAARRTVGNCPDGEAQFAAFPALGIAPLTVKFKDRSTASAVRWSWDFGDGTTSDERNPTHVYAQAGSYDVRMKLGDGCGKLVVKKFGIVEVVAPATQPWDGLTLVFSQLAFGSSSMNTMANVFDMSGALVHTFAPPIPEAGFGELCKPLSNGRLLAHVNTPGMPSAVVEMDWQGNLISEISLAPEDPVAEFQRLPNGNTLVLTQVQETWPNIRPDPILNNYVHEVNPDGVTVWSWSAAEGWDELPLSAAERAYLATAPITWIFHMNSVAPLPPNQWSARDARFAEGNLLISMRESSKVFILEKATKKVLWSFSGAIGQHHARMIPVGLPGAGQILIFDNGSTFGAPPITRLWSRIVQVDPTTGDEVWVYEDPGTFFNEIMGSCQRLPNGNTLVGEADNGLIHEVDPAGNVLWSHSQAEGKRFYRAYRVGFGWPSGPIQFPW